MKVTKTIPEKVVDITVQAVILQPESYLATVRLQDAEKGRITKQVDLAALFEGQDVANKELMKTFYKLIAIDALNQCEGQTVTITDIPEDIFLKPVDVEASV